MADDPNEALREVLERTIDRSKHRCAASVERAITSTAPVAPIVLDLPVPPSANRLWRNAGPRSVIRSSAYTGWLRAADAHTVMSAQLRGVPQITGPFAAEIIVQRTRGTRADLDNYCKPVLDWLQSRSVIRNDRDLERVSITWGSSESAPEGCRVTLTAVSSA